MATTLDEVRTLFRVMERNFGPTDAQLRQQIQEADAETLLAWSERMRWPRAIPRDSRAAMRCNPLSGTWDGVYELPWGGHLVRLIVLNRIEKHPRNAPWELFASERDRMRQGLEHYRARPTSAKQPGYWELLEHLY